MLEVADVCLRPAGDDAPAAIGFSHQFKPGEITVVLGANQSGKTDLCRLIAGLNTRASGKVMLDGAELTDVPTRTRPVGMVYQAFVNYPNFTVAQNIASPLRARVKSGAEADAVVADIAARLGIEELLSRYPHELSGGQQQRLAIARALAKQARVLLLDEPLVNLDFKLREALEIELRELLHGLGTVVIYTSSDPRDAFNLGDHLLLLDEGNKVQAGTPLQVYRAPSTPRAMELLAEPGVNYFHDQGAQCALRPEHVRVHRQADADDVLTFDMSVSACETNGDESFVHGRVADQEWVVRSGGMLGVAAGEPLTLYASAADVVRF
jgi:glycerol transport system ATP-binding protein